MSAEIEAVLMTIGGVLEVAVFAVADDRFGEAACACIHARAPIEPGEVFAYCTSRLAGFKLPRYVVPLATPLPRLANEKIDRRQLKADFADVAKRLPRLSSR